MLAAVAGAAVAADKTCAWVAERIWWIGGTVAVSFALAVAVSMALEAWAGRRAARFAARHGILSRADVIAAAPVRPAISPVVNFNFYAAPAGERAAVIRTVIPGKAGDAITEGEQ